MAVAREHVKALIDHLSDNQVQALWVILNSMAWQTEKISQEEADNRFRLSVGDWRKKIIRNHKVVH